ncbi:hypothetical protein AB0G86_40935 [Streptomyces scabiei]|uniref:hypothetical protein n=1 Tax=Streptomyces scabiei TaxID=1930 RepID=UPI00340AA488
MARVVVGMGNVLLCCVLLLVAVGVLFVEPVTRAEETAAWHLAARIHGWWFLGARGAGGPTVTGNGAG